MEHQKQLIIREKALKLHHPATKTKKTDEIISIQVQFTG